MVRGAMKEGWCDCWNGPQPVAIPLPPTFIDRFEMYRDGREDGPFFFPETVDRVVNVDDLGLEHLSRITLTFWKPIVIPIDVTISVKP